MRPVEPPPAYTAALVFDDPTPNAVILNRIEARLACERTEPFPFDPTNLAIGIGANPPGWVCNPTTRIGPYDLDKSDLRPIYFMNYTDGHIPSIFAIPPFRTRS